MQLWLVLPALLALGLFAAVRRLRPDWGTGLTVAASTGAFLLAVAAIIAIGVASMH